jgi:hypothetical protein
VIVVIEPIAKEGPRGDRDTQTHPYKDYHIHVLASDKELPSKDTIVHEVDGFDNWWTTIRKEDEVKAEATEFARRLAKRFGTTVVWSHMLGNKPTKFKVIRAVVECKVPDHITEKALVNALTRILVHPIQLGFQGQKDTLVTPSFKQYSRVRARS